MVSELSWGVGYCLVLAELRGIGAKSWGVGYS